MRVCRRHANAALYVYFPIEDDDQRLPTLTKLRAIAVMAASLIRDGHVVLSHCGMGYNRSALVAGLILVELGMSGTAGGRPPSRAAAGRALQSELRRVPRADGSADPAIARPADVTSALACSRQASRRSCSLNS